MNPATEDRKTETRKSCAEDTQLMDIEPGGENTIYEGQQTRVAVMPSNHGQFDQAAPSSPSPVSKLEAKETSDREEMSAEVTRFDEAISHGFGGKTSGILGKANQVEPLRKNDQGKIGGR